MPILQQVSHYVPILDTDPYYMQSISLSLNHHSAADNYFNPVSKWVETSKVTRFAHTLNVANAFCKATFPANSFGNRWKDYTYTFLS